MAGRGRGRGSAFSYTAEVLGLGRGADAIPASVVQPPPPFPNLQYKPVPLASGESVEYTLLLKQEFRGSMKDSPCFIKPLDKKKDIQRYSDKYQSQIGDDQWLPNFKMLPKELNYTQRKRRKVGKKQDVKPTIPKTPRVTGDVGNEIVKTLETLEKKEDESSKAEKKEGDEDDADDDEEEENEAGGDEGDYYEDEEEEGNDYLVSYFDPGEDYLDEDDGNDDGPIY